MGICFVVRIQGLTNITGGDRQVKRSVDWIIVRERDRNSLDEDLSERIFVKEDRQEGLVELSI